MDDAAVPGQPHSWQGVREWEIGLLERRTGHGVEEWNRRVVESGAPDEESLRAWLTGQGVDGYPRTLLVMERFGYPDFLLASADQLLDGQYGKRPALRPILDAILALAPEVGDNVSVQVRKTFVTLVSPKRTFAQVKAYAHERVDLALRLDGVEPTGRLEPAGSAGNDTLRVKIALTTPDDIDDEVLEWLRRAYRANV